MQVLLLDGSSAGKARRPTYAYARLVNELGA